MPRFAVSCRIETAPLSIGVFEDDALLLSLVELPTSTPASVSQSQDQDSEQATCWPRAWEF